MGSGRKPTPPGLKLLQGTKQADRPQHQDAEDDLTGSIPEPPQHLNTDGVEIWNRTAKRLMVAKALTDDDVYLLEQLACAWQQFRIKARAGMPMTAAQDMALKALLSELGMSPVARLKAGNGEGDSKPNRFARNGRR